MQNITDHKVNVKGHRNLYNNSISQKPTVYEYNQFYKMVFSSASSVLIMSDYRASTVD